MNKDLIEKIWTIDSEDDRKGTWWWWFWLFFIDNPKNPEKPHQLMILWSTKNEKSIKCNNRTFSFPHDIKFSKNKAEFDGVTAAWYYNGKMHHNYILEECDLTLSKKPYLLKADSKNKTSFFEKNGKFKVLINNGKDKFDFTMAIDEKDPFTKYTYTKGKYPLDMSYSALGVPKTDLNGTITEGNKKTKIKGTAYFQYVIVNAPSPSWYWGIFHFKEGSILSYFNPHIGPAVLKGNLVSGNLTKKILEHGNLHLGDDLYFLNKKSGKKEAFKVKKIKNKKNKDGLPLFEVKAQNKDAEISFEVDCYSDSYWEFDKKSAGVINSRLRYNEYPAIVRNFTLKDKKGKVLVNHEEIGNAVGNAEHSWGMLL